VYAGAVAGVDVGCSYDEDASAAISAPKDWDCDIHRAFQTVQCPCAHAAAD
jgi:hypothetical protein